MLPPTVKLLTAQVTTIVVTLELATPVAPLVTEQASVGLEG